MDLNSNFQKFQVMRMNEEEHLRNEKMYMAELDHPFINKLIRTYKDQTHVRSYLAPSLDPCLPTTKLTRLRSNWNLQSHGKCGISSRINLEIYGFRFICWKS